MEEGSTNHPSPGLLWKGKISCVWSSFSWWVPRQRLDDMISPLRLFGPRVYACLIVTCQLRFWQNDQGLLLATAVTRGWNGYRNKSQHKVTLSLEKTILPPLLMARIEPTTFRSRIRRSTAEPHPRSSDECCVGKRLISASTMPNHGDLYIYIFVLSSRSC